MRPTNGCGPEAIAARGSSRKLVARSEANVETVSIDTGSGRVDCARSSSDIWSYDGHDHLTDLSDDTPRDDPTETHREIAGHDGHAAPTPRMAACAVPRQMPSRPAPQPKQRTSGHTTEGPAGKALVQGSPTSPCARLHSMCAGMIEADASPASPSAESVASSLSSPVDTDWHIVTPPSDSELPPALRQGQLTPPQRAPRRSRMHASLHAQTRSLAPDSTLTPAPRSMDHQSADASKAFGPLDVCEPPRATDAPATPCAGRAACMHEPAPGSAPAAISPTAHDAPQPTGGPVTPPQLQRRRHSGCSDGNAAAPPADATQTATRIPRVAKRARRLLTHPTSAASNAAPLPPLHGTPGWPATMLHMLRWLVCAIAVACALAPVSALIGSVLPLSHNTPSASEVQRLDSLLDALDAGFAAQAAPRAGRAGAAGVSHTPRGAIAAALEVVSAAEVAQGRLRVSMGQVGAAIPAAWENAATALDATVSDLKRDQLVDLTMALQAAEVARTQVATAAARLDAAARSGGGRARRPQHSTDAVGLAHGPTPAERAGAREALRAVAELQGDVFRSSDAWRRSVTQAARAWVSLNATCAAAEDRFVSLATWTAARRRPSATSVARVALYHCKRQVAAHALHASASGAAWLRRTRDAVQRSAQHSGRVLQRAGARARQNVHRGRAWVGGAVSQGATWLEDVAGSARAHAANALGQAKRQVRKRGLDKDLNKAWQGAKRIAAPLVDDIAPPATRARVSEHLAAARATVARRGQQVIAKLPAALPPWRTWWRRETNCSGGKAAQAPTHNVSGTQHQAPSAVDGSDTSQPDADSDRPARVHAGGSGKQVRSANATLSGAAAAAAAAGGRSNNDRRSLPAALVALAPPPQLLANRSSGGAAAGAARRGGSRWRGSGGLTQHASRGGALEASGPQKELDQIAELTAPWEILVLTPKLLRHAVNALGAELASVLDAAAMTAAEAPYETRADDEGSWHLGQRDSDDVGARRSSSECGCRWNWQRREQAGREEGGAICWCGLEGVVGEVLGGDGA